MESTNNPKQEVMESRATIGIATIIFSLVTLVVYVHFGAGSSLAAMTGQTVQGALASLGLRSATPSATSAVSATDAGGICACDAEQCKGVLRRELEEQRNAFAKQAQELRTLRLKLANLTERTKGWEQERAENAKTVQGRQAAAREKLSACERARGQLVEGSAAREGSEQAKAKARQREASQGLLREALRGCRAEANRSAQETQAKLAEMDGRIQALQEANGLLKEERRREEEEEKGEAEKRMMALQLKLKAMEEERAAAEKAAAELEASKASEPSQASEAEERSAPEQDGASWRARLGRGRFNLSASHPIGAEDPGEWRQRSFTPHGFYSFIQYSAYRVGPQRFGVAGIGDASGNHDREGRCTWHGRDGGTISGRMNVYYDGHASKARYTTAIFVCILESDTGDDGGFLVGAFNQEEMVLFREEPGQPQGTSPSLELALSYCSPPMHGPQEPAAVRQWFDFHRVHARVQHFTLYNVDAVDDGLREALRPYLDAGQVDVVEVRDVMAFDYFYFGQVLMIHDCVFSMALRSRWVFFLDFDEYLEAIPPHTVPSLLSAYEDRPWLSHGSVWWNVRLCVERNGEGRDDETERFAVERTVFRDTKIYCFEEPQPPETREMCIKWQGHRKLILNPRKVRLVQVHTVVFFDGEGVDLNAGAELRHNHFRMLNVKEGANMCAREFRDEEVPEGTLVTDADGIPWQRDASVVRLVETVRANPMQR